MTAYSVSLVDLRAALQAVAPFADREEPKLSSLWLMPGERMHVYASDGNAAAIASVRISRREDGNADPFLISPMDAKRVLAVFPAPKKERAGSAEITIDFPSGGEVRFSDTSSLVENVSLTCRAQTSDVPDLRTIINAALNADPYDGDAGIVLRTGDFARIRTAATAYGASPHLLTIEEGPDGGETRRLVATIGDDFLAVTRTAVPLPPGATHGAPAARRAWRRVLEGVGDPDFPVKDIIHGDSVTHDELARRLCRLAGLPVPDRVVIKKTLLRDGKPLDRDGNEIPEPMTGQEELPLDSPTRDRDDVGGYPLRSVD